MPITMPADIIKEFLDKELISITLREKELEKAKEEAEQYLKEKNKEVLQMNPLAIYYVISKLSSLEQILFIDKNIDYIKKNNDEIFLNYKEYPKPLCHFLSFEVIKEIYKLDKNIFMKMLSSSYNSAEAFFNSFTHEDYMEFFSNFSEEINELSISTFMSIIYLHSKLKYQNTTIDNIKKKLEQQKRCDEEFIPYIFNNYYTKILSMNDNCLLSFLADTVKDDVILYKSVLEKNKERFTNYFQNVSELELEELFLHMNSEQQVIIFSLFSESIFVNKDINNFILSIHPLVIFSFYKQNNVHFSFMTIDNMLNYLENRFDQYEFMQEDNKCGYKQILDSYEINNIQELFELRTKRSPLINYSFLKHVETRFRDNIVINGNLEDIDDNTSVFSEIYFKNLKELSFFLKNHHITKKDESYKKHLALFMLYLQSKNIVREFSDNYIRNIELLFYRIVMGQSMTILLQITNIEDIAMINRLGSLDFNSSDFTVEQIEHYHVKEHRKLYSNYGNNLESIKKQLILKLMLMIGYQKAKFILSIDDKITTLEHLIGPINTKNIVMDEQGNPVLNKKIINLLFSDKGYMKIRHMLNDKESDLYKYFPRIFNEWDMIQINHKDKSLKTILDFLKSDDILLSPKYYRLEGQFKFIGCAPNVVKDTLFLHDEILKRTESTIPRVTGFLGDYSYEVLKLDDMEGLSVGNKTSCCFHVLGVSDSSLKHAMTSKNGRILVIKKNGQLMAHSWLWRNGNLLCLDNIEVSQSIEVVDFLDVYLKFADDILKASFEVEGINCIKNITIGRNHFDKKVEGLEKFPCYVTKDSNIANGILLESLPQPMGQNIYSDAKECQCLIGGNGIFHLEQSNAVYQDERENIFYFDANNSYDDNYLEQINKKINGLRFLKYQEENRIDEYKLIRVEDTLEAYGNADWYYLKYKDGTKEEYIHTYDDRAVLEYRQLTKKKKQKVLKK